MTCSAATIRWSYKYSSDSGQQVHTQAAAQTLAFSYARYSGYTSSRVLLLKFGARFLPSCIRPR